MFYSIHYHGGEFFKSDMIPFPHAFSSRSGGVSGIAHLSSMNVALGRGDDRDNVYQNRRILAEAAGAPDRIVFASQVHSREVVFAARGMEIPETGLCMGELDGMVTDDPALTLLVKVADCAPILLCDPETGLAGAIHAGWRGSAAGIASEGVALMIQKGANPSDIRASIGPCIHPCCFEVGTDFKEAVTALRGAAFAARHIKEMQGRLHADLPAMNLELLLDAGLKQTNIDISPLCTCCQPERFFSHRATKGLRGTMGAVISPAAPRNGELADEIRLF